MDHSSLTIQRLKKLIFCPELRYFRIGGDDDDDFDFGDNEWENVFVTTGHATQRNRQKRQMYEAAMAPKIEWGQKGKVDTKMVKMTHMIQKMFTPQMLW